MIKGHLLKGSQIKRPRNKGQKRGPRAERVAVSKEEFYITLRQPQTMDKSTIHFQVQALQKSGRKWMIKSLEMPKIFVKLAFRVNFEKGLY